MTWIGTFPQHVHPSAYVVEFPEKRVRLAVGYSGAYLDLPAKEARELGDYLIAKADEIAAVE